MSANIVKDVRLGFAAGEWSRRASQRLRQDMRTKRHMYLFGSMASSAGLVPRRSHKG